MKQQSQPNATEMDTAVTRLDSRLTLCMDRCALGIASPWWWSNKKELAAINAQLSKELAKCKAVTRRLEKLLQRSSGI